MVNFILIAFCIGAGLLFKAQRWVPADAHKSINAWILYVALPAVSFKYLPQIEWSRQMLVPVLSPVVVWAGSWLFMEFYCRYKKYGQRSRSSLELAGGYSNTSFIGFPLVAAYLGEQHIPIAIICDQATFLLLATAGIVAAVKGGGAQGGKVSAAQVGKRLLSFPPFIGCMLALVLSFLVDLSFAEPFFDRLAATVGPLALFSIGLQLKFNGWRQQLSQVSSALVYKLLLAPALVVLLVLATGTRGAVAQVSVLEAAMPTLVSSGIVAEQYRLNARLVNLIIGIGILLAFLSTACWSLVVQALG
ncbi:AEC family transporter [Paraflavisolibacter sp. H34]|uniref:AEC family transporter n=1 Tax=Huijunlia imazamoxiresistens TaxID=3127457 RepID=UPI00301839C6